MLPVWKRSFPCSNYISLAHAGQWTSDTCAHCGFHKQAHIMTTAVDIPERFDFETKNIREVCDTVNRTAVEHGFGDTPLDTKLLLIVGEIAEAQEELRAGHGIKEIYYSKDKQGGNKPEGFPMELADAAIRIFNLASELGIDLLSAMQEKAIYNESRPYKHGKAF